MCSIYRLITTILVIFGTMLMYFFTLSTAWVSSPVPNHAIIPGLLYLIMYLSTSLVKWSLSIFAPLLQIIIRKVPSPLFEEGGQISHFFGGKPTPNPPCPCMFTRDETKWKKPKTKPKIFRNMIKIYETVLNSVTGFMVT